MIYFHGCDVFVVGPREYQRFVYKSGCQRLQCCTQCFGGAYRANSSKAWTREGESDVISPADDMGGDAIVDGVPF